MPTFGQTPEALLGRNDSKNAATTCRSLTSSGRACRRALGTPKSSPVARRKDSGFGGVVAVIEEREDGGFYCWQHKDQADVRGGAERGEGDRVKMRSRASNGSKERSSIDTMVQRLGLDVVSEERKERRDRHTTRNTKPPLRAERHDFMAHGAYGGKHEGDVQQPSPRKPKKVGCWSLLCCMTAIDEEDYVEVVRYRKRTEQDRIPEMVDAVSAPPPRIRGNQPTNSRRPSSGTIPARKLNHNHLPVRPSAQGRSPSNPHTNQLLSLIPPHLSPQTTSALLAELIKPISPHDEEGYIYIFWLTPQSRQAPAEETARSLLSPPASRPSKYERRISDVMTEYSFDASETVSHEGGSGGKKTVMLKIGRANNVTRRMNEWQRQCGYALNLVRWYPYLPSSIQDSPTRNVTTPLYSDLTKPPSQQQRRQSESMGVRKVPCVKRVERLIHLELQDQQVKRRCDVCGKEHREWFAVEASQAGIRGVDECVRRWVGWAERDPNFKTKLHLPNQVRPKTALPPQNATMAIELDPETTEQVLANALAIASTAFIETSYFLLAGLVVLAVGLLVGYILVKSLDRDQDPFVVFRLQSVKPVPLLTSILIAFFLVIQVGGTAWKVFTSEDPVSLSDVALVNAAATVGAEAACLVIFWLTGTVLAFVGAASEVAEDGFVRSRSRGKRSE
ncbi:hypothetical protein LTR01_004191 [Friedmanniomyces endolithicus]|nr:hypothetical protein LTR01_004191 [Friedmanniomyces endolithicus]